MKAKARKIAENISTDQYIYIYIYIYIYTCVNIYTDALKKASRN